MILVITYLNSIHTEDSSLNECVFVYQIITCLLKNVLFNIMESSWLYPVNVKIATIAFIP